MRNQKLALISLSISSLTMLAFIISFWGATPAGATTEQVTRLVIPEIGLEAEVVPVGFKIIKVNGQVYGQWLVDDYRVGWHNLTAPLGEIGNTVLNGHDENGPGQVFRNLKYAKIGNKITVFSGDQVYRYHITNIAIVQEGGVSLAQRLKNATLISSTNDERLTLITCLGVDSTHRLIVTAYPVPET